MKGIKITFNVDCDAWDDAQFEDQESQEFIITNEMICEIIEERFLKRGFSINEIESVEKIS